jgi:transcriptional regulator with XRE-family HTH domain
MVTDYFLTNLNNLLKEHELSQLKLSSLSGIPQGMINKWFIRKTVPSMIVLEKLAAFFQVEPYYFFMKPGTQGEPKPTEREDSFKDFMDELAVKILPLNDQAAYHAHGGAKCFVAQMRGNYETDALSMQDWYLKLSRKLTEYAGLNLIEKVRERVRQEQGVTETKIEKDKSA